MNPQKICKLYLLLKEYSTYCLENAVCNHGFFMMAPNVWDPVTKSLSRPLRLSDSISSVNVTISKPSSCNFLLVLVHEVDQLYHADKEAILDQVSRMMRLSAKDEEDVQKFQQLHSEAKTSGFGRIFRAPTLFEDAVKCILLCFCNWQSSLRMVKSLCELQLAMCHGESVGSTKKRKRDVYSTPQTVGNFPSAQELADVDLDVLRDLGLGLRAHQVQEFAKDVVTGRVNLSRLEACESQTDLHRKLMQVKGFGYFVTASVSMCMGFYQHVPVDTETLRHLKEVHKRRIRMKNKSKSQAIAVTKSVYKKYAPFQCLAFWYELSAYYNSKFGKLSELPSSSYCMVTGSSKRP